MACAAPSVSTTHMFCLLKAEHFPTIQWSLPCHPSILFPVLDSLWSIPVLLASSCHQLFLLPTIPPISLSKGFNSCNTSIGRKGFTWRLLVYRIVGEQSVCLAGRYAHKYCREPTGSGHFSKQLHLRHQDHRSLWLES